MSCAGITVPRLPLGSLADFDGRWPVILSVSTFVLATGPVDTLRVTICGPQEIPGRATGGFWREPGSEWAFATEANGGFWDGRKD